MQNQPYVWLPKGFGIFHESDRRLVRKAQAIEWQVSDTMVTWAGGDGWLPCEVFAECTLLVVVLGTPPGNTPSE